MVAEETHDTGRMENDTGHVERLRELEAKVSDGFPIGRCCCFKVTGYFLSLPLTSLKSSDI